MYALPNKCYIPSHTLQHCGMKWFVMIDLVVMLDQYIKFYKTYIEI